MSDITANIIVEPINLTVQAQQNEITITPEAIGLNVYLGGIAVLGGNVGELQYNNGGTFGGVPNTNVVAGNLFLGNVANVKIGGGLNTYYLQTDGTGNLSWGLGAGNITGNGTPGGSVNQIQYNKDGANFGGSAGFTFDPSSNAFATPGTAAIGANLTVTGNANITGNIVADNFVGTYGNGTSNIDIPAINGNINFSFAGNPNVVAVSSNAMTVIGNVTAINFIGNLNGNATTAGTVTTAAQPNITSVGTLTNLAVSGNANITSNVNVLGSLNIQRATEKFINTGNVTGNVNLDVIDQSIAYFTATGNLNLNIRGNSSVTLNNVMNSNNSLTCAALVVNGATPYVISNVSIDGSAVTVRYPIPGVVGAGTPNGIDSYTFNIIKTAANTYTVLGSRLGHL